MKVARFVDNFLAKQTSRSKSLPVQTEIRYWCVLHEVKTNALAWTVESQDGEPTKKRILQPPRRIAQAF